MKSRFAKIPIALLITLIIGGSVVSAQGSSAPPSYKIKEHVFAQANADVNGDGVKDYIQLTGTSDLEFSTIYVDNIKLNVYDGKTDKVTHIPVSKINSGYTPRLFLVDINKDKAEEMLVSIPSGGSGGMETYSLISFKNNKIAYLFDPEKFSYGLEYDVEFKEGFKVDVHVKETNKTYSLDISNMKDIYIELKVYDKEGKLLQSTSGMRNPLSGLEVKVINGKNQLVSLQRVVGTSNAETLGYVKGTWDIENNEVKLVNVEVVK